MKKYHYSYRIGTGIYRGMPCQLSEDSQFSGIPFYGTIIAEDAKSAMEITKQLAESTCKYLFENKNLLACGAIPTAQAENVRAYTTPQVSCSLSVLDLSVTDENICHSNAYDDELRDKLNEIYHNVDEDVQERFVRVFQILWERDREEVAHYWDEECVWWRADEVSFAEMVKLVGMDEMMYVYFNGIADDGDLELVINYVRMHKLG